MILILSLVIVYVSIANCDHVAIKEDLQPFIRTLEQYTFTPNEVVFLLDESGSIGADRYLEVKHFTNLVVRHFSVTAEHTRVAIVSFADVPRTMVDYLKNSDGKNMCSLVKSIEDLDYVGRGTYTSLAMERAREILAHARTKANKILLLLSDGQSNNGYSPRAAAARLKQEGVVIFSVGVANVNQEEIEAVATSKDHIYVLNDFNYIIKLNEYLRKESNDSSWDRAKDVSLCNRCVSQTDCCDEHAGCYCGTLGGSYDCVCDAGYQGKSGLRDQCYACLRGTYKSKEGNIDCNKCPPHSTTMNEGSISREDCICEVGHEKHGNECKPVECVKLQVPDGGVIIPADCSNLYGSQCTLRCKEGYCPYSCNLVESFKNAKSNHLSLPSRTCLKSGNWSGDDFHCEQMRCPVLKHPDSGTYNCSGSDFIFGTTCHFECETGYELSGSPIRTCLPNGTWTGTQTHCKEIQCEKLKVNNNLLVKPGFCGKKHMPYRSVCQYYCAKGYSLTSQFGKFDGKKECLANKTWTGEDLKITCADISPPRIECPSSIVTKTETSKATASVKWEEPVAKDNVYVSETVIRSPSYINKPFYTFPIGTIKILYEASDSSNNSNTCSFSVTVQDEESPKVLFCPDDIEVYNEKKSPIQVKWQEPKFSDNSGKLKPLINNRRSGSEFQWGPPSVIYYNVSDFSGNNASCTFKVKVKAYPCPLFEPPANGVVTCDKWQDGRLCSVFCNDGYEFASVLAVPNTYECNPKGSSSTKTSTWLPFPSFPGKRKKFLFPVPDCSRKVKRAAINETYQINYSVDFCNDKVVERMKNEFIKSLKSSPFKNVICPVDTGCKPENVNVSCGSSPTTKFKRSIASSHRQTLVISFSIAVYPNSSRETYGSQIPELVPTTRLNKKNSYLKGIEGLLTQNVREVYNTTSIPAPKVSYSFSAICTMGQINLNNLCVNCPVGTYKDDRIESCVDCPSATYQEIENSLACSPCPKGYTTYKKRSKFLADCKAPCQPGTFSRTTFEPCMPCSLNTYQENLGGKECLKCPRPLLTWDIGSNSSSDCASACEPGSYSSTGLEPCTLCDYGSYQNNIQQKSCNICPAGTNTRHKGSSSQTQCKEIDLCEELHPCSNSSTCVPTERSFKCLCGYGYIGKYCETLTDFCENDPCFNNGTCTSTPEGPKCKCADGFSGQFCEINIDDCELGYCHNDGKCIDLINAYSCECQKGFSGTKCEINIFDCESEPCLNGGTCFDQINGYKCCCPEGYYGANCENKVNLYEEKLCKNGICTSYETSYKCDCYPGYSGSYCEKNTDDCVNYSCFNNGSCIDGLDSATCECPKKFSGKHCEEALSSEYLLKFQNPVTSNYVELQNPRLLYGITVSFFMRTSYKDSKNQPTVISYSYYDKEKGIIVDNGLTLFNLNKLVLYLHGQTLHTGHIANSDSNWHHYAVTWERDEGKWSFFVDGKSILSGRDVGKNEFIWPGIFIIGQEQDTLGGGFSVSEAFAGDVTEFNIWDYALTEKEIFSILSSCGKVGNLIPWYIAQRHVHGSVSVVMDVDLCKGIGSCVGGNCFCFHSDDDSAEICKRSVMHCNPNPCHNNQPCVLNAITPYCNCSAGYDGKFCEYDMNECLTENGGCSHQCINTMGSYECKCPDGMHLSNDGLTCKDVRFCKVEEQLYLNGESWMSNCQRCSCEKGIVNCIDQECANINCLPEENFIIAPGECCPKCISYSFCLISPNSTLSTFDYSRVEFSKEHDFTLVEDCYNGDFSVRLESSKKERNLSIYQTCSKVQITATGALFLNNGLIPLPYDNEFFKIASNNESIDVWTQSGLYIEWLSRDEILVAVPSGKAESVCGLCRNYQEYNMIKNSDYKGHSEVTPLVRKFVEEIPFATHF